jgi:protein gp37
MNRASSATGWVRNLNGTQGYTWNPITGCLNHIDGMCKGGGFPCYAYKLAHGRLKRRYLANDRITRTPYETTRRFGLKFIECKNDPFYPRFWPEKIKEIERPPAPSDWAYNASFTTHPALLPENRHAKRKVRGIFPCDMSDLFGIGIPEEWTKQILDAIQINGVDRFYLLTKQPQNLIKWSPFPENCWVGVTATDRKMFNDAIWHLMSVEAKVKYISLEPLLAPITASILDNHHGWPVMHGSILHNVISWIIIGQQTPISAKTQPKIEWIQEIVEAADQAGVPVFLKDNLKSLLPRDEPFYYKYYPDIQRSNAHQRILRQEFPKC